MVEAIHIRTGQTVNVRNASKSEAYECPHCHDEVVPVQGDKLAWCYRHREENTCIGTEANPRGVGER